MPAHHISTSKGLSRFSTDGIGTEFWQALNSAIKTLISVYNDTYKFHLDH